MRNGSLKYKTNHVGKLILPIDSRNITARMSDGSDVYEGYWAGQSEDEIRSGLIKDYTQIYRAKGYQNFELVFV